MGCLIGAALICAVTFGAFFAFQKMIHAALSGMPNVPPGVLQALESMGEFELSGELVTTDIEQELGDINELDLRIKLGATQTNIIALDDSPLAVQSPASALTVKPGGQVIIGSTSS